MKSNNESQKGFALAMVLFVVVGVSLIIFGVFSNLSRHQRDVGRGMNSVSAHWVAESLLDATVAELRRFVTSKSRLPEDGADFTEIKNLVLNYFSTNAAFAAFDISSFNITQLPDDPVHPIPMESNPEFNIYQIHAGVKHVHTQAEVVLEEDIQLNGGGSLFDYGVIYDKDLEISAVPTFSLGGPIFSNKNVYLASGSTLLLDTPKAGKHTLRSAGSIYFGFKRVVGKNYFLNDLGGTSLFSTDTKAAYPIYFNNEPNKVELFPVIHTGSQPLGPTSIRPYLYYMKNKIPFVDPINGVISKTVKILKGAYEYELGHIGFNEYIGYQPATVGLEPFISTAYVDKAYYTASGASSSIMSLSFAYNPLAMPTARTGWTPENPLTDNPPVNPNWKTGVLGNTALEKLVQDSVTHNVLPVEISMGLKGADALGDNAKHKIIEPLKSGDSDDLKKAKLMSKAKIKFLCRASDSACSDFDVEIYKADGMIDSSASLPFGTVTVPSLSFPDVRLETNLKYYDVDMSLLAPYIKDKYKDDGITVYFETKAFGDASYSALSSIRAVKLKNGAKLPPKGLTIATNGRLWIEGDYNTQIYNADETEKAICNSNSFDNNDCVVPPTSIFSDSFGVLSNQWYAHSSASGFGSAWLAGSGGRNVGGSGVIVNTAVVTGQIPSQLQKAFPNCDGVDISKCVFKANSGMADANWLSGSTYQWLKKDSRWAGSAGWATNPDTSGAQKSWLYNDISTYIECPSGLDADGKPVDPSNCAYYRDMNTGFYYISRSALVYARTKLSNHPNAVIVNRSNRLNKQANYFNHMKERYPNLRGSMTKPAVPAGYGVPPEPAVTYTNVTLGSMPGIKPPQPNPSLPGYDSVLAQMINNLVAAGGGLDFPSCDGFTNMNDCPHNQAFVNLETYLKNSVKFTVPVDLFVKPDCDPYAVDAACADTAVDTSPIQRSWILYDMNELIEKGKWKSYKDPADNALLIANPGLIKMRRFDYTTVVIPRKKTPLFSDGFQRCGAETAFTPQIINTPRIIGTMYFVDFDICDVKASLPIPGVPFNYLESYKWMAGLQTNGYAFDGSIPGNDNAYIRAGHAANTIIPGFSTKYMGAGDGLDLEEDHRPAYKMVNRGSHYISLYTPKYSGGLENLINLQEDWSPVTVKLRFMGTLAVLWDSQELRKSDIGNGLAFYDTVYYEEPLRTFKYDENFLVAPPAGFGNTFTHKRLSRKTRQAAA